MATLAEMLPPPIKGAVSAALATPRDAERWVFELQLWVLSHGASALLGDLEPYEPCRVGGVVERLRIDPVLGILGASISDGTGSVLVEWDIRRPTLELAVAPGRVVVLQGVALPAIGDELLIREPSYEVGSLTGWPEAQ